MDVLCNLSGELKKIGSTEREFTESDKGKTIIARIKVGPNSKSALTSVELLIEEVDLKKNSLHTKVLATTYG